MTARILVVDDHAPSAEALAEALADAGYDTVVAHSGAEALAKMGTAPVDAVVSDVRMDGMDGVALLREVRSSDPDLPVLLVTAHATVDKAIEATRAGAFCYLTKPLRVAEVEIQLRNALALRRLATDRASDDGDPDPIVGSAPALLRALATADRAARSDLSVLLHGETGTGKELFARRIHRRSPRAGGPFVGVNMAAIPDTLVESELFGHARGAFTGATAQRAGLFEAASGGTLFLDELGELGSTAQTRLLRVLQERVLRRVGDTRDVPVDVRIVAATHRDLDADTSFRRDLYYRVAVITIELPPLRQRVEDIPVLLGHALKRACARAGRPPLTVEPEVLERLIAYRWPGNVRELVNLAERAAVLSTGDRVSLDDLPTAVGQATGDAPGAPIPDGDFDLTAWLEGLEETAVRRAMARCDGVKTRAAAALGLERNALRYKLKKYGIDE